MTLHVSSDATIIERRHSSHELEATLAMRRERAMRRHWANMAYVATGIRPRVRVQAVPLVHDMSAFRHTKVRDICNDRLLTADEAWPDIAASLANPSPSPSPGRLFIVVQPPTRVV